MEAELAPSSKAMTDTADREFLNMVSLAFEQPE
jgi:hypothetical protein